MGSLSILNFAMQTLRTANTQTKTICEAGLLFWDEINAQQKCLPFAYKYYDVSNNLRSMQTLLHITIKYTTSSLRFISLLFVKFTSRALHQEQRHKPCSVIILLP